jgi:hypothetical protein
MPDATRLLSDEPEMETSLQYIQLLLAITAQQQLSEAQQQASELELRLEEEQLPAIATVSGTFAIARS